MGYRYFDIRIDVGGFVNASYSIYYDSILPSNYAKLYDPLGSTQNATGLTYTQLTTGAGVRIEVPDTLTKIILYDANNNFCVTDDETSDIREIIILSQTPTPTPTPTITTTPTITIDCVFDVDVDVIFPTPTPTSTPTSTSTITETPTITETSTYTPDCTFGVDIDVIFPTPTPTFTPTSTSTSTETPTITETSTYTPDCVFDVDVDVLFPTPTPTSTPTVTQTPTETPTSTFTPDCVFEGAVSEPLVIDQNTEINIWFDDSGSMDGTLSPLQTMRTTILRDCLVQFYANDYNLYDQNVKVNTFSSKSGGFERTFYVMNTTGTTQYVTKVINLVFQDEASTPYDAEVTFNSMVRTGLYNTDMSALRTTLDNVPNNGYYRGIIFRVNTGPNTYDGFRQFISAVINGTGAYSGVNGLSDKGEITWVENVTGSSTPQYYADQIITALNTLGYNLNLCGSNL